jgi:hypothetical protein
MQGGSLKDQVNARRLNSEVEILSAVRRAMRRPFMVFIQNAALRNRRGHGVPALR